MTARSTERVVAAAAEVGLTIEVSTFPDGTKTAADAAAAIGCALGAIVKSLVFLVGGRPVVALVPGDLRLSTAALGEVGGSADVVRAPLDVVREATGFVAGGTPPFAYPEPLPVFADEDLRRHDPVWAAAGTPTTVFPISIADLDRVAAPRWASIATGHPRATS